MFDHLGWAVRDFPRTRAFYVAALAPLGCAIIHEGENWAMFGRAGGPGQFWLGAGDKRVGYLHLAFTAETRAQVDAFHAAALTAGGIDYGAPGVRAHYHANYYGAFVLDPDGINVEAVCHAPEP